MNSARAIDAKRVELRARRKIARWRPDIRITKLRASECEYRNAKRDLDSWLEFDIVAERKRRKRLGSERCVEHEVLRNNRVLRVTDAAARIDRRRVQREVSDQRTINGAILRIERHRSATEQANRFRRCRSNARNERWIESLHIDRPFEPELRWISK